MTEMTTGKLFAWTCNRPFHVPTFLLVRPTVKGNWVYNFCIHDVKTGQSDMYVWEENVAGRGSDEIGSCWQKWLDSVANNINKVTVFADNCGGQSKNIVLALTAL